MGNSGRPDRIEKRCFAVQRTVVQNPRRWAFWMLILLGCACTPRTPVGAVPGTSPDPGYLATYAASSDATYVGVDVCTACHSEAGQTWRGSAHAHARDTLRAASAGSSPDCLPCHVTGMGRASGWAGAQTPTLEHVTCEACHGRGSAHVDTVSGTRPGTATAASGAFPYGHLPLSAAACIHCHTESNSPDFRFAEYWAKIRHE